MKRLPDLVTGAFLYVHILDLLDWGLVDEEEAACMASRLLPGDWAPEPASDIRQELAGRYIHFLLQKCQGLSAED